MKTLVKTLAVVASVVALVGTTSCSRTSQLEKYIKSEVKKDAKENGVKVKFNSLEVIKMDSIPDEYNGLVLKWLRNFNEAELEFNRNMDMADFYLKIHDLDEATEYRDKAQGNLKNMEFWDNSIKNELKLKYRECFIAHVDCLATVGNIPVRVNKIVMYKYQEKLKDGKPGFELCYETDNISGFEKYKK